MPIRADTSGLNKLARQLADAGERGRKELGRATIDMRRRVKPEANKEIRKEYNVKVGPINERLRVQSEGFTVTLGVTESDKLDRIPIKDFNGTRVTPAGVRIKPFKKKPSTLVERSFQGTARKKGKPADGARSVEGRLLRREEKDRLPIRSIGGYSAQAMLFEREGVVEGVIDKVLIRASKDVAKRIARLEKA